VPERAHFSGRSRDVVVTGIALRSALGDLESTWTRLLAGQTALRMRSPFPEIPARPLALLGDGPVGLLDLLDRTLADLADLADLANSADSHSADDLAKTADRFDRRTCAVSVGSSRSMQRAWEDWLRSIRDSADEAVRLPWLMTLPQTPALHVAKSIGSRAAVFAPMAACATGLWSIARGVLAIRDGTCDRVVAGSVEAPISPLTIATFDRMGALSPEACRPFDRQRSGMALGEGAALLLLEARSAAVRRGATIYGRLVGVAMTADAHHISAPDPDISAARSAVRQCLDRSGWDATSIDYIHLHGTGTRLNDRREAELVRSLFPNGVAVSSTKGATGHTVGASGAIGAALCLRAIASRTAPPCVGLREPEFAIDVVREARSQRLDRALCFSFGFGGQNVVLALERDG